MDYERLAQAAYRGYAEEFPQSRTWEQLSKREQGFWLRAMERLTACPAVSPRDLRAAYMPDATLRYPWDGLPAGSKKRWLLAYRSFSTDLQRQEADRVALA